MEPGNSFVWYELKNCARCGGNHPRIEFTKLKTPIIFGDNDEHTFNYWALCPETNEPILCLFY